MQKITEMHPTQSHLKKRHQIGRYTTIPERPRRLISQPAPLTGLRDQPSHTLQQVWINRTQIKTV